MWTQSLQSPSDSDLRRRQGRLPRQPLGPVDRLVRSGGSWLTEKNRALCISPNGTYIGGYATRTQSSPAVDEPTAVAWSGTTMSSLFTEPTLQLGRGSEARAVNNSGEFVGSRTLENSVGQFIPRAFRGRTNGAGVSRKAWRWPNGWSDGGGLDDKINTYGFNELWSLDDIVDVTDLEVILGNGVKSGSKRGFLLIPQVNQN